MTKLETLNRRMLLLEREVSISCEEYDTYKALLEAVEALKAIKSLLDGHPQAAVGNTKVHVAVCKATGALNAFKEDAP